MSEAENLVLEHLRAIRGEIGKLSEKVDVFGLRISALESRFGALETRMAGIEVRLDRIETRVERIERRLDLVDAPLNDQDNRQSRFANAANETRDELSPASIYGSAWSSKLLLLGAGDQVLVAAGAETERPARGLDKAASHWSLVGSKESSAFAALTDAKKSLLLRLAQKALMSARS